MKLDIVWRYKMKFNVCITEGNNTASVIRVAKLDLVDIHTSSGVILDKTGEQCDQYYLRLFFQNPLDGQPYWINIPTDYKLTENDMKKIYPELEKISISRSSQSRVFDKEQFERLVKEWTKRK